MATRHYVRCKRCGKHRDEVGEISWRGLCAADRVEATESNVDQMHDRRGPNWDRWRAGMIRAAGGLVPEQLLARERSR